MGSCFWARFGVHVSDKNSVRGLGLGELELARKATNIGGLVHAVPKLLRRRGFESEVQTQHGKQKMNRFLKRIVAEGLRHRVLF